MSTKIHPCAEIINGLINFLDEINEDSIKETIEELPHYFYMDYLKIKMPNMKTINRYKMNYKIYKGSFVCDIVGECVYCGNEVISSRGYEFYDLDFSEICQDCYHS
jgi:hypothetical protein